MEPYKAVAMGIMLAVPLWAGFGGARSAVQLALWSDPEFPVFLAG